MDQTSFPLFPVAPFRLDLVAWLLRRRLQNRIDTRDGRTYRRLFWRRGRPVEVGFYWRGWLVEVGVVQTGRPRGPELEVTVRGSLPQPEAEPVFTRILSPMLGLEPGLAQFHRFADRGDEAGQAAGGDDLGMVVARLR